MSQHYKFIKQRRGQEGQGDPREGLGNRIITEN